MRVKIGRLVFIQCFCRTVLQTVIGCLESAGYKYRETHFWEVEDLALTIQMQHCAQAIASGGDSSRKSLGGF